MPRLRIKPNALSVIAVTLTTGLIARPAAAQYIYQNAFTDKSLVRAEGTLSIFSPQAQYSFRNATNFTTLPTTGTGWRTEGDGRDTYLGISDINNQYSSAPGSGISGFTGDTTVTLNLTGLTAGNRYNISFDLFLGKSLDGNSLQELAGPDRFQVLVNQNALIDTTFNNYDPTDIGPGVGQSIRAAGQAYSDSDLTGFNPADPASSSRYDPFTGADVSRQDPRSNQAFNNYSIYYFGSGFNLDRPGTTAPKLSFVATGDTAQIQWISDFTVKTAQGERGEKDDFWALDNLQVTDLPEPGSFGMMALGLIPLGVGLYRMRRK